MKRVQKQKNDVKSRHALFLVAALLVSSSVIRVGSYTGSAFARETGEPMQAGLEELESPNCAPTSPDIAKLLAVLRDREERIKQKEDALIEKDASLALAEEEIQRNLTALEEAENKLASTLALADKAAEVDLATLTTVYENMKPKEASALFEEMNVEFAAGFLGRMRPDVAASILAGLSAQKAYSISVVLAGRNANVPRDKN